MQTKNKMLVASITLLFIINYATAAAENPASLFQKKPPFVENNEKNIYTAIIKKNDQNFRIIITKNKIKYGIEADIDGKKNYIPLKDKTIKEKIIAAIACEKGIFVLIENGKILHDKLDANDHKTFKSPVLFKTGKFTVSKNDEKTVGLQIDGTDRKGEKRAVIILLIGNTPLIFEQPTEKKRKQENDDMIEKMIQDIGYKK